MRDDVTIIIPTACADERYETIKRAISSLSGQELGCPLILVVANGPRVSERILEEIATHSRIKIVRIAEGSLPRAIAVGRSHVTTPYFGYLDDDDEYLPHALTLRLRALEGNVHAAVCATDGYRHADGVDRLIETVYPESPHDPLRGLLRANWLASCAGLFRTDLVPETLFDGVTRYYEWTLLAYKLAISRQVVLLPSPTYRLHVSSGSLSRSDAYRLAEPEVLKKIYHLNLPNDQKRAIAQRIGAAYHALSGHFHRQGQPRKAWEFHMRSLLRPSGWRYASYTARLLKC